MADEQKTNPVDATNLAFFKLATIQARNTMRLCNALRFDPAVSEETKKAAIEAFESVQEMLDLLDTVSETNWGPTEEQYDE